MLFHLFFFSVLDMFLVGVGNIQLSSSEYCAVLDSCAGNGDVNNDRLLRHWSGKIEVNTH
jgi:hypothetical protein